MRAPDSTTNKLEADHSLSFESISSFYKDYKPHNSSVEPLLTTWSLLRLSGPHPCKIYPLFFDETNP